MGYVTEEDNMYWKRYLHDAIEALLANRGLNANQDEALKEFAKILRRNNY